MKRPMSIGGLSKARRSTIDDYAAFGQMMLSKGKLGNHRVLSRPSLGAGVSRHAESLYRGPLA